MKAMLKIQLPLQNLHLHLLDKLDKLDGIETKISNFQVALTNVTDKIAEFTEKLQILDTIPILIQRIDVAIEDTDKLKVISILFTSQQIVSCSLLTPRKVWQPLAIRFNILKWLMPLCPLVSRNQQKLNSDSLKILSWEASNIKVVSICVIWHLQSSKVYIQNWN